jgi:hypothetical protein
MALTEFIFAKISTEYIPFMECAVIEQGLRYLLI